MGTSYDKNQIKNATLQSVILKYSFTKHGTDSMDQHRVLFLENILNIYLHFSIFGWCHIGNFPKSPYKGGE